MVEVRELRLVVDVEPVPAAKTRVCGRTVREFAAKTAATLTRVDARHPRLFQVLQTPERRPSFVSARPVG